MNAAPEPIPLDQVPPHLEFAQWVGALVREHRGMLVRVAVNEGLQADEALDAVQDGFAAFVEKPEWRDLPRDTPDASRLLATLVKNQARNLRRRASRKDAGMDALTAAIDHEQKQLDELLEQAEEHLRLTGCIATLKQVQQTVVTARLFEGVSGQEVARELGLQPGNVAVILHRAQGNLRGCLETSREKFRVKGQ
ncbi:MAG: sigma-70 family RNA polymerase sigma factor [Archangium sp.]|nr:sigma-70 family RNA polymerase sigma factor [Archangium sp.]MDP3152035.1 sigma-70 family RNA polymerase sigma factor [Archangium sp.]MDP3575479.1 sigma-70 family RNA polymerase sigma factor [Archangium sp.]